MEYIKKDLDDGNYETYMLVDNKKEGQHRRYDENGRLWIVHNFINNKSISYKMYNKYGELVV